MLKVLGSMLILLASVGFGFQIQMDLKKSFAAALRHTKTAL